MDDRGVINTSHAYVFRRSSLSTVRHIAFFFFFFVKSFKRTTSATDSDEWTNITINKLLSTRDDGGYGERALYS